MKLAKELEVALDKAKESKVISEIQQPHLLQNNKRKCIKLYLSYTVISSHLTLSYLSYSVNYKYISISTERLPVFRNNGVKFTKGLLMLIC